MQSTVGSQTRCDCLHYQIQNVDFRLCWVGTLAIVNHNRMQMTAHTSALRQHLGVIIDA